VPGKNEGGKPGKPYIVKVNLIGYFAPEEKKKTTDDEE